MCESNSDPGYSKVGLCQEIAEYGEGLLGLYGDSYGSMQSRI